MVKAQYSSLTVEFKTRDRVINETNYASQSKKNIRTDIKVLILNQDINDDLVIITADLIWFSEELTKKIKSKLLEIFLLKNEKNFFMCFAYSW